MTKLHISSELALPEDTATSTLVVYGGKGMGKTNLGSVLVEELTKARLRWCVLDPMGVWWGLRHSSDGKGPGIECVILGGPHGDIPIEPTGGAIVADLVADEGVNTVIDFSRKPSGEMWSIGEKVRFVTEYALRLFRRQGELVDGRRREPLFQLLDEAARYIPQLIPSGNPELAKSVGAWEQITEEGRNVGLGVGLLTQRSARLNKSVAELADAMFAFRTVGPNSLDAVMDWLGEHIEKARAKDLATTVRALDVGQALVVSPGWLRAEKVVQIRARETFDSSATPKAGQRAQRVSGKAARPDLAKYRERMAATIEKVKADDPKALRAEVAELKKQLAAKGKVTETIVKKIERLEVPVLKDAAIARLETTARALEKQGAGLDRWGDALQSIGREILTAIGKAERSSGQTRTVTEVRGSSTPQPRPLVARPAAAAPRSDLPVDGSFQPSASQQRILDVLAWLAMVNVSPAAKAQVAGLAGQSPTSGGYFNNLGKLRSAGLIDYVDGKVFLTDAGRDRAVQPSAPPTNEQLHDEVAAKVSSTQAKILRELIAIYPRDLSKDELAERTGQSPTSGGYFNNLGRLRSLGFIDYPTAGRTRAAAVLFLEERAS